MTGTITSALDLLNSGDLTFRLLLQEWWSEKVIPFPLLDRLLDADLYGPADGLRWMLEQPLTSVGSRGEKSIPLPYFWYSGQVAEKDIWGWSPTNNPYLASHLPIRLFRHWYRPETMWQDYTSPELAFCAALDAWRG